jgi:hypothetical protein
VLNEPSSLEVRLLAYAFVETDVVFIVDLAGAEKQFSDFILLFLSEGGR